MQGMAPRPWPSAARLSGHDTYLSRCHSPHLVCVCTYLTEGHAGMERNVMEVEMLEATAHVVA